MKAKNDKTGKKFWNLINAQRKRREKTRKEISMQQWAGHFKEQLGAIAAEEWQAKERVKNDITKYEEDRGIKVEEIRKIISKMRKRKGPGEDGIPNEAWMHGEEELIDDLNEITKFGKGKEKCQKNGNVV